MKDKIAYIRSLGGGGSCYWTHLIVSKNHTEQSMNYFSGVTY